MSMLKTRPNYSQQHLSPSCVLAPTPTLLGNSKAFVSRNGNLTLRHGPSRLCNETLPSSLVKTVLVTKPMRRHTEGQAGVSPAGKFNVNAHQFAVSRPSHPQLAERSRPLLQSRLQRQSCDSIFFQDLGSAHPRPSLVSLCVVKPARLRMCIALCSSSKVIGRLHRTRTTGIRSTGLVRQDRQILTNKDK